MPVLIPVGGCVASPIQQRDNVTLGAYTAAAPTCYISAAQPPQVASTSSSYESLRQAMDYFTPLSADPISSRLVVAIITPHCTPAHNVAGCFRSPPQLYSYVGS